MTPLRDWARLDARWYEDPVLLAAAEECVSAFHLWPVLVGKAKHESHETANPSGAFTTTPRKLAADAWVPLDDVRPALDALARGELISFAAEGTNAVRISLVGFAKWQTPRRSNAEAQARKRWDASREKDAIGHGVVRPASWPGHGSVMPDRDEDVEKEQLSSKAEPSIDVPRMLFDHWLTATNRSPNQNRLTAGRRAHVNGRLRDGYTVEQLQQAIDGIAGSAWHTGANPGSKRYDTFDFIMRSGENVEKGMEANSGSTAAADLSAWGATGGAA